MDMAGPSHEEVEATRRRLLSRAVPLVDEARALSYALIRVLASTPREKLSREDIDALCQLAYELLNKLNQALEFFEEIDEGSDT
jgi:hypothetical protein